MRRRAGEERSAALEPHLERAAGEADGDGRRPNAAATATALVPDDAVSPAPRSHTRASISPSPSRRATWTFVRFGKPRVRLEQRADARQVVGVAFDDGVRVADVHRDEADAVDLLRLGDRDLAEVLLDEAVLAQHRPAPHAGRRGR